MTRAIILATALFAAACSGDEAPSCQQAIGHYYEAGCTFFNDDGSRIPAAEIVSSCKQLLGVGCDAELDNFNSCMGDVPNPATNADCDCTQEQDDLLRCL